MKSEQHIALDHAPVHLLGVILSLLITLPLS
jgi:hypothetical protein